MKNSKALSNYYIYKQASNFEKLATLSFHNLLKNATSPSARQAASQYISGFLGELMALPKQQREQYSLGSLRGATTLLANTAVADSQFALYFEMYARQCDAIANQAPPYPEGYGNNINLERFRQSARNCAANLRALNAIKPAGQPAAKPTGTARPATGRGTGRATGKPAAGTSAATTPAKGNVTYQKNTEADAQVTNARGVLDTINRYFYLQGSWMPTDQLVSLSPTVTQEINSLMRADITSTGYKQIGDRLGNLVQNLDTLLQSQKGQDAAKYRAPAEVPKHVQTLKTIVTYLKNIKDVPVTQPTNK
jgi:hypothetical protein